MDVEELNEAIRKKRELRDVFNLEVAQAIRNCGRAILAIHHNKIEEAKTLIEEASSTLKRYKNMLPEHPRMYNGVVHLEQELVEARGYLKYVEEKAFLERTSEFPESYVLGMADLIGELRRRAIEEARQGRLEEAMKILEDMERLYTSLREIDYTGVKELRHKLDGFRRSIATLKEELTLMLYLRGKTS